jgi:uncharacterized repeat protein (TIGR01451 family)
MMMPPKNHALGFANMRALLRLARLVSVALLLSSCRSGPQADIPLPTDEATLVDRADVNRVAGAIASAPSIPVSPIPFKGMPIPITTETPWAPPGLSGPWPHDEYLEDGGDEEVQANIGSEGELRGLELEDTVAVYNTRNGETCIAPSNKVCLYAPRFAAVRQVTSVLETEQRDQLKSVAMPRKASLHREDRLASTAIQPIQPEGEISTRQSSIERTKEVVTPVASRLPIAALQADFALHENFRVMRRGQFEESEKTRLLEAIDAAITWTHAKAVQVVLNGTDAVSVTGDQRVQATFRVDEPDHPCLRVIKVASTKTAKPGDIVDFTIRFDNMGDQEIKHVVLVDNLTTRLEYVPGTAQSSRDADFTTEQNEGDSLVLRWDFTGPLPKGAGGLVRFHCRVR